MSFQDLSDGLLDGRYRVQALVFLHTLFLFSKTNVHFFLADVDADLIIFHNVAMLLADFWPPSNAHKPYRFRTNISIQTFGMAGSGRSKKILGSSPVAATIYRLVPLSLLYIWFIVYFFLIIIY